MDRFMLHLKNSGYMPQDAKMLLKKADNLSSEINSIIRDARVSKKYLEFDISVSKGDLDLLLEKLEPMGKIEEARHLVEEKMEKNEAMQKAKFYFNNERFWESHEVLESVWKKTYDGEKDLVQGIILVAAALVHYQKYENEICLSILRRAMEKLGSAKGKYHEIDIDDFKRKTSNMIDTGKIATFTM